MESAFARVRGGTYASVYWNICTLCGYLRSAVISMQLIGGRVDERGGSLMSAVSEPTPQGEYLCL